MIFQTGLGRRRPHTSRTAAYYIAFGPHGPRTPANPPGTGTKVTLATLGLIGVSGLIFFTIRAFGSSLPSATLTSLTPHLLAYSSSCATHAHPRVAGRDQPHRHREKAGPNQRSVFLLSSIRYSHRTQVSPPRATRARVTSSPNKYCYRAALQSYLAPFLSSALS